ncbi:MAG: hypothetical protein IKJ87_08155 [Ruminococcus sp.]|nr:hypothetical protein [Ruminococcus sp.]
MKTLSENEKKALRYYIGDVFGNDTFYGDKKAYIVINSLFFPDIFSESARAAEGKYLNTAIIEDVPRLLGFFEDLFSVFGKVRLKNDYTTYRVERMADFELCHRYGRTISMTSTAISGFLDSYRDRRGIALMKFRLAEGNHCINVAETLDYYAKPEETEILIPPFMEMKIRENSLADSERRITDCDGNPPVISVDAEIGGICGMSDGQDVELYRCNAGIRLYKALNEGNTPDSDDIAEYILWKKLFQKQLKKMFSEKMTAS